MTPTRRHDHQLGRLWLSTALVAVLAIAAAVSLNDAFAVPMDVWVPPASVPAVVGLVAAALVRTLGARMLRPLAAGLVAALLTWCWQWWPETLMVGLIPQPATVEAINDSTASLREIIWTDVIPVTASAPVLAGVGAAVALTALVTDAIAVGLRSPAIAGIPPLALVSVAAAIIAAPGPWPAVAVAAAAWLGLLALGPEPEHSPVDTASDIFGRPAARLGTLATGVVAVLALVVSLTSLPYLSSGFAPDGQRFLLGQGSGPVDPAADLGQVLRSNSGFAGITYDTDDGRGVYLRTAVVDDVTASPWDSSPPRNTAEPGRVGFVPAAARLRSELENELESDVVSVTLDGWTGKWAPLPDQVLEVAESVGDVGWQVDPATSTAFRPEAPAVDLSFRATMIPLDLTLEEMSRVAGDEAPQSVSERWGADPALADSTIQERAEEVTEDADDPVEQAVAIQDYLLSDAFVYSETAPQEQGFDGSGIEMTEQFLEAGAGYCIHFASAMVMMAQAVDIPARVVVGYAPVAAVGGVHRVTSDRAHAWPELYIDAVGWVPFEPTQGVGRTPEYSREFSSTTPVASDDPTVGDSEPSDAAEPEETEEQPDDAGASPDAGRDSSATAGPVFSPVVAILGGLLVLLAALVLLLPQWWRRRRRHSRLASGTVEQAWAELEDSAVDLELGRQPHESESAFAARLDSRTAAGDASAVADAGAVAEAVAWARYAPEGTPAPPHADAAAESVRAITADLFAGAEPAVRRRARWFPRSVLPGFLRR
ncbi:transglutaminaseTgpA domain-containing protein [Citricoccus sp. GCM10030269]|uniref:transglutaminase family protein n=1 Tax=Citricoccus sp. GCM10030269 TaxID=3273388 RepID=UPI00361726AC